MVAGLLRQPLFIQVHTHGFCVFVSEYIMYPVRSIVCIVRLNRRTHEMPGGVLCGKPVEALLPSGKNRSPRLGNRRGWADPRPLA